VRNAHFGVPECDVTNPQCRASAAISASGDGVRCRPLRSFVGPAARSVLAPHFFSENTRSTPAALSAHLCVKRLAVWADGGVAARCHLLAPPWSDTKTPSPSLC